MGKGIDERPDTEDYQFMKEMIKKKTVDRRAVIGKVAAIIGGGLLFGLTSAASFAWIEPSLALKFEDRAELHEDVKLNTPTPAAENAKKPDGDSTGNSALQLVASQRPDTYLQAYEEVYREVLEISKEPRKSLVMVSGISENRDLLDNSILSSGDSEGFIFLENEENYYILTIGEDFDAADHFQVVFSNRSIAIGELCKYDANTDLAVIRVPLDSLPEEARKEIAVATLGNTYSLSQAKPVIAIGSPNGESDAVLYGGVTSVTGKIYVADAEYNLMTTDMQGSPYGSGLLLDTRGEVIGIITARDADGKADIIRAVSIAQLRPLIETLSNGGSVNYLGIRGMSITDMQAETLGIPKGVYVNEVDKNSSAMTAGIQNGDIITSLAGKKLNNMQSYSTILQKLTYGQKVSLTLARKSAEGTYVNMEFKVTVQEN